MLITHTLVNNQQSQNNKLLYNGDFNFQWPLLMFDENHSFEIAGMMIKDNDDDDKINHNSHMKNLIDAP